MNFKINSTLVTMKIRIFLLLLIPFWALSCQKENVENQTVILKNIAFGSCNNQWFDMRIFNKIRDQNPDLYLALGDNMYSDVQGWENLPFYPNLIELGYDLLFNKEPFKTFAKSVPIIATWDDHDYGLNNAGKNFPHKAFSKNLFMKYYQISKDSPMRSRKGIYNSYYYGDEEHRVQIIMLDTRWFLDVISAEPITPTTDITKTILGTEQWAWLEEELKVPAKVRIIGTSTQFGVENNGWETWANYPHEMERFYEVIRKTQAEGLFFVSGDIHYAEINKREVEGIYPLYDVTSSGLTHFHAPAAKSTYRVGSAYTRENFGMIRINWETAPVEINFEIYTKSGELKLSHKVTLDELKF